MGRANTTIMLDYSAVHLINIISHYEKDIFCGPKLVRPYTDGHHVMVRSQQAALLPSNRCSCAFTPPAKTVM